MGKTSWLWLATFVLLRKRPNPAYLRFATDYTKVMEVLSDRLRLVTKVVPHENLMETAEQYASMIMSNSPQTIRSAKETILDVVGRTLDDALRLETINAYSSLGDFSEAKERLSKFYSKGEGK
jgi:enoyl-CoA hydratase/carnithine racemase